MSENKKEAQIVLRVPTDVKNALVKASQAEGVKLSTWITQKAMDRFQPSWKQLVGKRFDVPDGATGFHTRGVDGGARIVYTVNLREKLPDGRVVVSGVGFVEHDLAEEQAEFLRERAWLGSMGWWFWDCDKHGAARRAGAKAPWEVQGL